MYNNSVDFTASFPSRLFMSFVALVLPPLRAYDHPVTTFKTVRFRYRYMDVWRTFRVLLAFPSFFPLSLPDPSAIIISSITERGRCMCFQHDWF